MYVFATNRWEIKRRNFETIRIIVVRENFLFLLSSPSSLPFRHRSRNSKFEIPLGAPRDMEIEWLDNARKEVERLGEINSRGGESTSSRIEIAISRSTNRRLFPWEERTPSLCKTLEGRGEGGGLTFDYTRLIVRPRGEILSTPSRESVWGSWSFVVAWNCQSNIQAACLTVAIKKNRGEERGNRHSRARRFTPTFSDYGEWRGGEGEGEGGASVYTKGIRGRRWIRSLRIRPSKKSDASLIKRSPPPLVGISRGVRNLV